MLSKLLGYAIIAGSIGVKLPQIMSIFTSKSAKGVSLMMFVLETIGLVLIKNMFFELL